MNKSELIIGILLLLGTIANYAYYNQIPFGELYYSSGSMYAVPTAIIGLWFALIILSIVVIIDALELKLKKEMK
jgi:uncharacterized membrane protein